MSRTLRGFWRVPRSGYAVLSVRVLGVGVIAHATLCRGSRYVQKPQLNEERGSQAAFTHFFTHRAMLRAYLHAMLRDSDLVDDTLSDTAVEVARCWDTYDPTFAFGPWVR